MKIAPLLLCAPLLLSLCGTAPAASAFGPTDPRTVINAVNTPGSGDATFRILNPGSYYLDQNLVGELGKDGILIEASNVRIDLMGFTVRGFATSLNGIAVRSVRSNIVISNGSIANWPGWGLKLDQATNVHARDIGFSELGLGGMLLGADSVAERCDLFQIAGSGIAGGPRLSIFHCRVTGMGQVGISAGQGSIVRECMVSENGSAGILLGHKSQVFDCTVTQNYSGIGGEGALIRNCSVSQNQTTGLSLIRSTVRDCEIEHNGTHGLRLFHSGSRAIGNRIAGNAGDGIWAEAGTRIEENDVRSHPNGAGIRTFGTGSFVVKNTLFGNSLQLSVPNAGNFVGPLVSVNAVYGRDDPWANFLGN